MSIGLLDIAIRGACTGSGIILVIIVLASSVPRETKTAFSLLIASVIFQAWGMLSAGVQVPENVLLGLRYAGASSILFFTWFFILVFSASRHFFRAWFGSAALVFFGLCLAPLHDGIATILRIYALAHVGALIVFVVLPKVDDLSEARRKVRGWVAVVIGAQTFLTALMTTPMRTSDSLLIALAYSSTLFASLAIFAVWSLAVHRQNWIGETSKRPAQNDVVRDNIRTAQTVLTRQIENAMQNGIWRKEGLTVSGLAQEVGAPDHQVRNAINQVLGHRNFSSFINQARIAAAQEHLAAPDQMGTSVQEIAFLVGFSSIGPFNRAFRDATGQSPSEFRTARLAASFAET